MLLQTREQKREAQSTTLIRQIMNKELLGSQEKTFRLSALELGHDAKDSKTFDRAKTLNLVLGQYFNGTISDKLVQSNEQLRRSMASNHPIEVAELSDGRFFVLNGNGRIEAMRMAFKDSDAVNVNARQSKYPATVNEMVLNLIQSGNYFGRSHKICRDTYGEAVPCGVHCARPPCYDSNGESNNQPATTSGAGGGVGIDRSQNAAAGGFCLFNVALMGMKEDHCDWDTMMCSFDCKYCPMFGNDFPSDGDDSNCKAISSGGCAVGCHTCKFHFGKDACEEGQ